MPCRTEAHFIKSHAEAVFIMLICCYLCNVVAYLILLWEILMFVLLALVCSVLHPRGFINGVFRICIFLEPEGQGRNKSQIHAPFPSLVSTMMKLSSMCVSVNSCKNTLPGASI